MSREALYELVWSAPLGIAAARLGLSANGLAKMCDRLLVPRPSRRHWIDLGKGTEPPPRPALPAVPAGATPAAATGARTGAGRSRTRLSLEQRREQLMDVAADLALADGLHSVSLKRVARDAGISEAQAHNCFAGRTDLILRLARRELDVMERARRDRIGRGRDRLTWIVLTTLGYLHAAQRRGPLLQMLLRDRDVRAKLRSERREATTAMRTPITERMVNSYGMSIEVAHASTAILTAITLRTGGLLAANRIDMDVAARLCLPMVIAGGRSNAAFRDTQRD